MIRARIASWIVGVAVLVLVVVQSVSAIGPAYVVLHGGSLENPVVLRPAIGSLMFFWAGGISYEQQREPSIPSGLDGRRYLDYDVFWGRFTVEELKPEAASQHGRLYLPTMGQAASVVLTVPDMDGGLGATRAHARPIPVDLKGFASGRALTPSETASLVAAGVPMQ